MTLLVACGFRGSGEPSLLEFGLDGPRGRFVATARSVEAPRDTLGGIAVRGRDIVVSHPRDCSIVRLHSTEPERREASSRVDLELDLVGRWGTEGLGRGEFLDPRGLAFLGDGRLVVIDHGNHRGQIFDGEGQFLSGFGSRLYVLPLRR